MKIPETPSTVESLDLMKRLEDYAEGRATWASDGIQLGPQTRRACRSLHTHLSDIVNHVFAYVLDRVTSHAMDTFTMHDRVHGRKVAHLMWHILKPERQQQLSAPEIGVLVLSAHLHDAGMALSRAERDAQLAGNSDLWDRIEFDPRIKTTLERLQSELSKKECPDTKRHRLEAELFQAHEFLLAMQTRERHATPERYNEIICEIAAYHDKDRERIPDIDRCMSFDGDSFKSKLIDVCISHNQSAESLIENDRETFERPRFPREYPVGTANVDLLLMAACLRLADILDFDRERTPPVLFHYLIPSTLHASENISALEWNKHLGISNWEIDSTAVLFRGRCRSHIAHHAVVQFCHLIEEEISAAKAIFDISPQPTWPFVLSPSVKAEIYEDGYHYVPYQFQLDDQRVYELLMGGAIYQEPLAAVRELIQNAVDACACRDALTKATEGISAVAQENRILVRYEEPNDTSEYPKLTITDTGTGMDAWLIERYFLRVGRSYYRSAEFNRERLELRRKNCDFAPISEFGIGFLSVFLLADRVEIETAMWEPVRGDNRKRHLLIDGPTRLIRLRETANDGLRRFKGTSVTVILSKGGTTNEKANKTSPPSWEEVRTFIRRVCQDLPYRIMLQHVSPLKTADVENIEPRGIKATVHPSFESSAIRIEFSSEIHGIEGEIAIVPGAQIKKVTKAMTRKSPLTIKRDDDHSHWESTLLRGGFVVGSVPGLPFAPFAHGVSTSARVRIKWQHAPDRRLALTNLARTAISDSDRIENSIIEIWMRFFIDRRKELDESLLKEVVIGSNSAVWFSSDAAFKNRKWLQDYDALSLYQLARGAWRLELGKQAGKLAGWEDGRDEVELNGFGISFDLLNLILPRVVPSFSIDKSGSMLLSPPRKGWREILSKDREFIDNPARWPYFAEYRGEIEELLFFQTDLSIDPFNSRYSEKLSALTAEELSRLASICFDLGEAKETGGTEEISAADASLLHRAAAMVGDAMLGAEKKRWRLNSLLPMLETTDDE